MRISVAIATYNGGRFLRDQLESIAGQLRLPDEVIISDDASSDDTVAIIQEFAERVDFDVVILRNPSRIGYADNFFRAMRSCTGDLIALSDQDDVWHVDKLARCELCFLDPEVSLVVHSARTVDEHLRPVWSRPSDHVRRPKRCPPGSLPPFPSPRAGLTMVFRTVFVTPADFEGGGRPGERMSHDVRINFVCGALGAILLLPDKLALFRRHPGTATESWSGHLSAYPRDIPVPPTVRFVQDTRRKIQHALALGAEEREYRARSTAARERQAHLERLRPLARALGDAACTGLELTIESHRRYAQAMDRRAWAYADCRALVRSARVIRHLGVGDYRARSKGRLGHASLLRDLTIGLGHRVAVSADQSE